MEQEHEETGASEAPQGNDAPSPAGSPADGVEPGLETLEQELEALRRQAEDNLDLARRTQADMENLRKRTARDVENAHKYALDRFVRELLPVLDSLELGLGAADAADGVQDSLREGMELTLRKFLDTLEKFGVQVVDPQGEKFDPEQHEAVSMLEQPGAGSGTVISVMQKGYALNGRLVRPAMVVVAR